MLYAGESRLEGVKMISGRDYAYKNVLPCKLFTNTGTTYIENV